MFFIGWGTCPSGQHWHDSSSLRFSNQRSVIFKVQVGHLESIILVCLFYLYPLVFRQILVCAIKTFFDRLQLWEKDVSIVYIFNVFDPFNVPPLSPISKGVGASLTEVDFKVSRKHVPYKIVIMPCVSNNKKYEKETIKMAQH